ncbi:fatty acid desaturase [Spongiibacter marinus]|jgi:stearoyl-CoA desaturase (delta-9 desaturase)|uniref:acyl-CoA desaturase n=1 Tax=Spongiibacter marinus TaxID=354246 RepID=UPI0019609F93|nr:fatty acid desaturase [Spongiibacter marinus]MBM7424130.1 stearoyl-CoA desaturase (delta-9 desaturase) [Spongiibacter marinus]
MPEEISQTQQNDSKPPLLWLQTILFSVTFLIAAIGVPWYGLTHGFTAAGWIGFVLVLGANGMSITAGYHRLWAHNAYKAHWSLKLFFALFGAAATQNSILIWASGHRRHHRHVDDVEHDPYSAKRGLWFSHIGWMLRDYPASAEDFSNARDLQRDKIVMWQHRNYLALVIIMNFLPALALGVITGNMLEHILLAGVLRLVVSHHTTFFINSLAHYWGRRPYTDENTARDNDLLALFTYGEGYHNYHHIFQNDYRNGIRWWQYDPTKWLIKSASWVGLTWDLRKVPDFKIQRAVLTMQFKRTEQALLNRTADAPHLREFLEQEYQQFRKTLADWNTVSQQWMDAKRASLAAQKSALQQNLTEHKEQLQHNLAEAWEHATLRSRFKELEYTLKMQRKRLQMLNTQMA